jgi:hypothetical protein
MCPSTTELLLKKESMIPEFEKWKGLFMFNRNEVMGIRTGHEMEEEDEQDGKDGGTKSSKRCGVL